MGTASNFDIDNLKKQLPKKLRIQPGATLGDIARNTFITSGDYNLHKYYTETSGETRPRSYREPNWMREAMSMTIQSGLWPNLTTHTNIIVDAVSHRLAQYAGFIGPPNHEPIVNTELYKLIQNKIEAAEMDKIDRRHEHQRKRLKKAKERLTKYSVHDHESYYEYTEKIGEKIERMREDGYSEKGFPLKKWIDIYNQHSDSARKLASLAKAED